MKTANKSEKLNEYLDVLGIQAWVRRTQSLQPGPVYEDAEQDIAGTEQVSPVEKEAVSVESVLTSSPSQRLTQSLSQPSTQHSTQHSTQTGQLRDEEKSPAGDISQYGWQQLKSSVAVCTGCELHESRTNTVFGVGDQNAQVMVIGEAPGADEDRQGEPFVGRAGNLLDNMLLAIGYRREQVYIANILKCRPPNNRDPRPEEIAQCEHYLARQVELIQPKAILAVGRISAQNLLKVDTPIGKLRGKLHFYNKIPVVVTYHPAYLLRKPSEKAKAWNDLRFAVEVIQGKV